MNFIVVQHDYHRHLIQEACGEIGVWDRSKSRSGILVLHQRSAGSQEGLFDLCLCSASSKVGNTKTTTLNLFSNIWQVVVQKLNHAVEVVPRQAASVGANQTASPSWA
jgi:hypothetical protein